MYYRHNNVEISYPVTIKPDEQNQSTWFVVKNAGWFSDNTDVELAAWGVTRHDDPIKPELDAYAEKLERGEDGEYQIIALTTEEKQAMISQNAATKKNQIRSSWAQADAVPVNWDNKTWNGGVESAMLIDAANRGALKSVEASEMIFDYHNQGHLLTTTQIDQLVVALRNAAKPLFHQKQAFMTQVQAIETSAQDENANLTQLLHDLDDIIISFP